MLADIVIGLAAHRWKQALIDHVPYKNLDGYLDRLRNRPEFAALAGRNGRKGRPS
jgi:hypothetical protein